MTHTEEILRMLVRLKDLEHHHSVEDLVDTKEIKKVSLAHSENSEDKLYSNHWSGTATTKKKRNNSFVKKMKVKASCNGHSSRALRKLSKETSDSS